MMKYNTHAVDVLINHLIDVNTIDKEVFDKLIAENAKARRATLLEELEVGESAKVKAEKLYAARIKKA